MEPTLADFRKYFRTAVLTSVLATTLMASFNVYIDPYGIFRHMHLPNMGYAPLTWSRVAAAERMRGKCDIAFLGSSRVVFGFGTDMPNWGKWRLCNGALGGTSIAEQKTVVEFITTKTNLKGILLFVDLHMFHDGRMYNHDWAQSRLNPERNRLNYLAWGLTSLDAIEWSTKLRGIWLPIFDKPKPEHTSSMETRGMVKTTLLRANMYRLFEGPDKTRALFVEILDEAQAAGLKVMVAIPAEHALQIEMLKTANLWDVNKEWKRFLTQETFKRGIPLWDFETYHSPAKSPLPMLPTDKPTPWWSDLSHQSKLLGDNTLERIQESVAGKSGTFEPNFGVVLTPDTIEADLAQMDTDRLAWRAANPGQIAAYEQILAHIGQIDPSVWADLESNGTLSEDGIVRRGHGEGGAEIDLGDEGDVEF
jgi:hypothetical protein